MVDQAVGPLGYRCGWGRPQVGSTSDWSVGGISTTPIGVALPLRCSAGRPATACGGGGTRLRRVLLRWQAPQPLPIFARTPMWSGGRPTLIPTHVRRVPLAGSRADSRWSCPPQGEWSGRAARSASRDSLIRRGRVLGGPSARAASGGNLKPALVATQGGVWLHRAIHETSLDVSTLDAIVAR